MGVWLPEACWLIQDPLPLLLLCLLLRVQVDCRGAPEVHEEHPQRGALPAQQHPVHCQQQRPGQQGGRESAHGTAQHDSGFPASRLRLATCLLPQHLQMRLCQAELQQSPHGRPFVHPVLSQTVDHLTHKFTLLPMRVYAHACVCLQVRRIVFDASYLVLGLGDVYLGAPCAVPVNPMHRVVTTKMNPARTFTHEGTVGE